MNNLYRRTVLSLVAFKTSPAETINGSTWGTLTTKKTEFYCITLEYTHVKEIQLETAYLKPNIKLSLIGKRLSNISIFESNNLRQLKSIQNTSKNLPFSKLHPGY